jgi:hypothetical protein
MQISKIFVFILILSFRIIGIGKVAKRKSVKMLIAPLNRPRLRKILRS